MTDDTPRQFGSARRAAQARGEAAKQRRLAAAARTQQLSERLDELERGASPTGADVEKAQHRQAVARQAANQARDNASQAAASAAQAHLDAARLLASRGDTGRAGEHRHAADEDRALATAPPDSPEHEANNSDRDHGTEPEPSPSHYQ